MESFLYELRIIQELNNNKTTQFKDGKRLTDPQLRYVITSNGKGDGARGIPIKEELDLAQLR